MSFDRASKLVSTIDGGSVSASVTDIANTGHQVAFKLIAISWQMVDYSDGFSGLGNEISLTASILQQLGECIKQDAADSHDLVFNKTGFDYVQSLTGVCERVFAEIKQEVADANAYLRSCAGTKGYRDRLSRVRTSKSPSVQPLKEARKSLMLMLQLRLLVINRKRHAWDYPTTSDYAEQQDIIRVITGLELGPREAACPEKCTQVLLQNGTDLQPVDMVRRRRLRAHTMSKVHSCHKGIMVERWVEESSKEHRMLSECSSESTIRPSHRIKNCQRHDESITYLANKDLISQSHDMSEKQRMSAPLSQMGNGIQLPKPTSGLSAEISESGATKVHAIESKTPTDNSSKLSLFHITAVPHDNTHHLKIRPPSINLVWEVKKFKLSQIDIHGHLNHLESEQRCSITEVVASLSSYERNLFNNTIQATACRPKGTVLALRRLFTNVNIKDLSLRLPTLEVVIQHPKRRNLNWRFIMLKAVSMVRYCHPLSCSREQPMTSPAHIQRHIVEANPTTRRETLSYIPSVTQKTTSHDDSSETSSTSNRTESIRPQDSASRTTSRSKKRNCKPNSRGRNSHPYIAIEPASPVIAPEEQSIDQAATSIAPNGKSSQISTGCLTTDSTTTRIPTVASLSQETIADMSLRRGSPHLDLPPFVEELLARYTTFYDERQWGLVDGDGDGDNVDERLGRVKEFS